MINIIYDFMDQKSKTSIIQISVYTIIIILILILNIFIIDSAKAEINSTNYHGVPSFKIHSHADKKSLEPGDNISIGIFISGAGDVDENHLRIYIPPNIIANDEVTLKQFAINETYKLFVGPPIVQKFGNSIGSTVPDFYLQYFDDKMFNPGDTQLNDKGVITPPLSVEFTINNKAPPGEHEIHIILLYKNGSNWYFTEDVEEIHISEWYERDWFYVSIILISLLSAPIFINFFKNIYLAWMEFFKKMS